jgi:hypothetical protein
VTVRQRSLGLTSLLIAAPRAALACPVCFGQSDSPMAWAMNMGIFAMLLIVGGVLVGFASFFVHLMRRARLADAPSPAEADDRVKAGGYRRTVNAREGRASC